VNAASPQEEDLDLHWLDAWLALGGAGAIPAGGAARLARDHGITHVVDLRAEGRDDRRELASAGIRLLWLPTPDRCAVSPRMILTGVEWVTRAFGQGGRVLVHCQHGIGRSALLALCVLVDGGIEPIAALTLMKDAREVVSPSPEQLAAFVAFAQTIQQARGAEWLVPSLDDLSRIAYRHLSSATGNDVRVNNLIAR
jgi:predicted protein tyrosine phosphatase